MAQTSIEWTQGKREDGSVIPGYTFNIIWGCEHVSPACDHCYAEMFAKRLGLDVWGPGKERRIFDEKYWRNPLRWNAQAAKLGEYRKVFCSSMADVFEDHPTVEQERAKLWPLIKATPNLIWMLLTKRAERIRECLPCDWKEGYPNVCLGVTAENQEWADWRIPFLLQTPARVRFVSYEPALGSVDFSAQHFVENVPAYACVTCGGEGEILDPEHPMHPMQTGDAEDETWCLDCHLGSDLPAIVPGLSWIIVGGESGPKARPSHPGWFRQVRDDCKSTGVSFFFKQFGEWLPTRELKGGEEAGKNCNLVYFDGTTDLPDCCSATYDDELDLVLKPYEVQAVGKKSSGRLLDGIEYSEFPEVTR